MFNLIVLAGVFMIIAGPSGTACFERKHLVRWVPALASIYTLLLIGGAYTPEMNCQGAGSGGGCFAAGLIYIIVIGGGAFVNFIVLVVRGLTILLSTNGYGR
jgi:hypothetical protein